MTVAEAPERLHSISAEATVTTRPTPPRSEPGRFRLGPAPGGFGVGVGLCLLLLVTVTWAVLSGGWVQGANGVFLVVITAVAEAALLAWARTPRIAVIIAAPFLAFAAVVPFTINGLVPDGDTHLLHQLARYLPAMWFPHGLFAVDDWTFTVSLATVLWVCGYLTTWTALRERWVGLGVFASFFVLAINSLNAPNQSALPIPTLTATLLAVTLVAQSTLSGLNRRWRSRRIAVIPGLTGRYVRSTGVVLLLVLLAAVVVPPASSHDFTQAIGNSARSLANASGNGGQTTSSVASVGFSAATIPGQKLSADHPFDLLRYTTNGPSPIYLSVVADSVVSAGKWTAGFQAASAAIASMAPASDGAVAHDTSSEHGSAVAAVQPVVTQFVPLSSSPTDAFVPSVGEALRVSGADVTAFGYQANQSGSSTASALISIDALQYRTDQAFPNPLTVTSQVSIAGEAQLRAAGRNYPATILADYLAVGGPQPSALEGLLTTWTGSASNPYDVALAIQNHLRDSNVFTYTLDPAANPASSGLDNVDYFLLRSHSGYCQYFASAMGILLRKSGIPSRLVNGFGPGLRDGSGPDGSATYTVSSNDAHTWVEGYFPGYGWIPFEPTPPSTLGNYQPLSRGPVSTSTKPTPPPSATAQPSAKPKSSPPSDQAVLPSANDQAGPHPPAVLVGTAVTVWLLLLTALALGAWLARPRDLRALWRRINLVGRLLGVARTSGDTDLGYALRLSSRLPLDTTTVMHPRGDRDIGPKPRRAAVSEALLDIAAVSGQARFSQDGIDAKQRVHWLRCWRRILRALPTLWWRSLLSHLRAPSSEGAVGAPGDVTKL